MIKPALAPTLTHAKKRQQGEPRRRVRRVYRGVIRSTRAMAPQDWVAWGVQHAWRVREGERLSGRFAVMIESTITSEVWPKRRKKTRCSARTDCGGVTTPGVPAAIASKARAVCTNGRWSAG